MQTEQRGTRILTQTPAHTHPQTKSHPRTPPAGAEFTWCGLIAFLFACLAAAYTIAERVHPVSGAVATWGAGTIAAVLISAGAVIRSLASRTALVDASAASFHPENGDR